MKVGARRHRTDAKVNSPHNEFWDLLTKKKKKKKILQALESNLSFQKSDSQAAN